jgi:predicted nucleotidyltransferase
MGELERIREILVEGPPLRLAILFGSRARGTQRPDSDIDLAILPEAPTLSLTEENQLAVAIERALGAPVDLVRLDQARDALRWRIARDGIVLLSNPPQEASRFLARAGIEHDAQHELSVAAMRRYRARLAGIAPGSSR